MESTGLNLIKRAETLVRSNVGKGPGSEIFLCGRAIPAPCRHQRPSAEAGFSLVEILCAVLVLGVALTGMVQGVTTALGSSKESELQTVAALFAAGQVETVRAEGDLRDGTTEGDCGEGLSLYRWQQTITAAGIDGLHEVAVVVENAKSGKTIYELRTLLFEIPDDSRSRSSTTTRRDSSSQRRNRAAR